MPLGKLVRSIDRRIERAIGADTLKAATRARLLTEQIQAIIRMTPAMSTGTAIVMLLLMMLTWGSPQFPFVAAWAAAFSLTSGVGLRAWLRSRQPAGRRTASVRAVRHACLNAFIQGTLWGLIPLMLMPDGTPVVKLAVGVSVTAGLCAAGFALTILPQAALAFMAPVLAGMFTAALLLDSPAEATALQVLLVTFTVVAAMVSARLVKSSVRHLLAESTMREQKDVISLLLKEFEENSSDWLWSFDRTGKIERASQRFAAAAGLTAAALDGRDFCAFLVAASTENSDRIGELAAAIEDRAAFKHVDVKIERPDGERWWRLTGKPAHDEAGDYCGYIGTAADVTAEKRAERRISFLAHNDALTGLANRARFREQLLHALGRLDRYGTPFALLFLDLDEFKSVNDGLGHLAGDRLLVEVAKRIRATIHDADIAARLGGDEFAVLLTGSSGADDAAAMAQNLVTAIGLPYAVDGDTVTIGASIGVALAPQDGTQAEQLLRNADLALYRAKAAGRGAFRLFESQMDADRRRRQSLEAELRRALENGELALHYQPLISADDDRTAGFEALLRWNHPERGILPPAEFIAVAEQAGLMHAIGDWTLFEACMAAARWPAPLFVAVNLSPRHFESSDIAFAVRSALEKSGLPPHRLELEVTERLLIGDPAGVTPKLAALKALGVTIAMDDFGTGYASLSHLTKFPFDKIKIDKALVLASGEDEAARELLRIIASLGGTLNITIAAEGVETPAQAAFLREAACSELQGFHFARPLDEFALAGYFLTQFGRVVRRHELLPPPADPLPVRA